MLGLVVKLVMMRLFRDNVKVSIYLVIILGRIIGKVIRKNVLIGGYLRFLVVFLMDLLKLISWD